jgi:hypothetical protein
MTPGGAKRPHARGGGEARRRDKSLATLKGALKFLPRSPAGRRKASKSCVSVNPPDRAQPNPHQPLKNPLTPTTNPLKFYAPTP